MGDQVRFAGYFRRRDWLLERCRDKRVLHLGCIGETVADVDRRRAFFLSDESLHMTISRVASEVVGIDRDASRLGLTREPGVPVLDGDVEFLDGTVLPDDFRPEVVVAGDLIEHLSSPGLFLQGVSKLLVDDGQLLLTTPNAFGLPNYARYLSNRFREGADHVQSYNWQALDNLLERFDLTITELATGYEEHAHTRMQAFSFKGIAYRIARSAFRAAPKLGGTLLVVAAKS